MSNAPEDEFFEASNVLGKAIQALSPEEKALVATLYDEVKDFAAQQDAKGVHLDKAAFFAAGLVLHPGISSEEVIKAAANLIEKDWLFVKANKANQETASP